jgi:hypothetical protein
MPFHHLVTPTTAPQLPWIIKKSHSLSTSLFVPIRHHSLNPVHVRAEVPHLHLLAFAFLDRQWVSVTPLVSWYIRRIRGIRKYIEHRRFVNHGKVGDHGYYLLEDGSYLGLYFGLWLGSGTESKS